MNLDPQEVKPSITRLKRARGQIDAVIRMLESGEECEAAITSSPLLPKQSTVQGIPLSRRGLNGAIARKARTESMLKRWRSFSLFVLGTLNLVWVIGRLFLLEWSYVLTFWCCCNSTYRAKCIKLYSERGSCFVHSTEPSRSPRRLLQ